MMKHGYIESISKKDKLWVVQVSLEDDEILDDIPYYQPFGHTSVPEIGSEVVVSFLDDSRDFAVALSIVNRDFLPETNKGDSCLYQSKEHFFNLKKDGNAELKTGNLSLNASGSVSGKASKWSFSVGETELLQVMVSLVETLMSNTQVNTVYGTSPLLNPNAEKGFAKVIEKLNQLRGE